MNSYCAYSRNHKCIKWTDYQLTRHELEEADELCHNNQIELMYLQSQVTYLEKLLRDNGIQIPDSGSDG